MGRGAAGGCGVRGTGYEVRNDDRPRSEVLRGRSRIALVSEGAKVEAHADGDRRGIAAVLDRVADPLLLSQLVRYESLSRVPADQVGTGVQGHVPASRGRGVGPCK